MVKKPLANRVCGRRDHRRRAGCNKSSSPVVPSGAAVLRLSIPPKIAGRYLLKGSAGIRAKPPFRWARAPTPEYYLSTDGQSPVTGVIMLDDGSQLGSIFINLPKAGVWLVSAEYFVVSNPSVGSKNPKSQLVIPGLNASPEFVGADEVDIEGTTSFTLNMEDIGSNAGEGTCYNGNMTDATDCEFFPTLPWYDLFTFDTLTFADSLAVTLLPLPTGDIQALYDPVTTLSTYLGSPIGGTFAYLGNGDLVNFPIVPTGTTFYANTLSAKGALLGAASAAIAINDVFVVKIPSQNAMVWVQPWIDNNTCTGGPGGSTLIQFWFVYNHENLNYMKFDETAYGRANCNQNPIPTPTLAP